MRERRPSGRGIVGPAVRFAAGVAALVIALGPALHRPAEELFSAHMVQHLLLVTVAPPLLIAGFPGPAVLARLPSLARWLGRWVRRGRRRRAGTAVAIIAWIAHVLVLWAWHVPALYEAALRAPVLHAVEHASLLGTAMAFWAVVLRHPGLPSLGPVAALLYLFAAAGQSTALGALLTLTAGPSYPAHAGTAAAWGLTPLADQQLAGAIMWVLGGLGYLGAALAILTRLLRGQHSARAPLNRAA